MRALIAFCLTALPLVASYTWKPTPQYLSNSLVGASVYQIYPRSFKDSDGDGVGDLRGVIQKLDHLVDANVDIIWISPIFSSPMVDFGYDISDFRNIYPAFGTVKDLEDLIREAHKVGIKVLLDFVPNHTSDQHEWFQKSLKGIKPYSDYYIWHPGKVLENGTRVPPCNWVCYFGGSMWEWRDERKAYYLHQFTKQQPDLDYFNPEVVREMHEVLRFWLKKGVDGFRIDALPHIGENMAFPDEPLSGKTNDSSSPDYTDRIYTTNQQKNYDVIPGWRSVLNEFKQPKYMFTEAYANMSMTMKYYKYGADFPFNFGLIQYVNSTATATTLKSVVDNWMQNMPSSAIPNWVVGNHDVNRLVSKLGEPRARALTVMTLLLPGVSVTYNGDEIGMSDTWISWEDTQDTQGCLAGILKYNTSSRDPARTPFQWDDSVSAGFSTNSNTWLKVNDNYKIVNLAAEKKDENSFYTLYKKVSTLRKSPYLKAADLTTKLLSENVFAFARETEEGGSVYTMINYSDKDDVVDLSAFKNAPKKLNVFYATANSIALSKYKVMDIKKVEVPATGVIILTTPTLSDIKFGNM
ncbi:alpha-glucosidase-like [Bombus pyrosoma]|uniref:alpha-glucosidase-like n=1 Tax=Bombus pyrosoma TaxID=396416 RepID=UPI001CB9ADBA|nr:alpha-glucosidase-like [Bombus pyrosoma]